jgi:O-methyltransferase
MESDLRGRVRGLVPRFGYDIVPYGGRSGRNRIPSDFDRRDIAIADSVESYTMTAPESVYSLIHAVEYVVRNAIPGAFVECGVWRGGSMMAIALTLLDLAVTSPDLYLFDTFEGMSKPEDREA